MSDLGELEHTIHTKPGYRVWMLAEIDVLNEEQVKELREYWDNVANV